MWLSAALVLQRPTARTRQSLPPHRIPCMSPSCQQLVDDDLTSELSYANLPSQQIADLRPVFRLCVVMHWALVIRV